jgi:hypothetical protein
MNITLIPLFRCALLTNFQTAGTRRKLDTTNEGDAPNQQQQKKRRMSTMPTGTQATTAPPLNQTTALPSVTSVADALREDSVTTEIIEVARVSYLSY